MFGQGDICSSTLMAFVCSCQESIPKSAEILNDFSPDLLLGPFFLTFRDLMSFNLSNFLFYFFPDKKMTQKNEKPFFRMRILKMGGGEDFSLFSHCCQRLRYSWRSMETFACFTFTGDFFQLLFACCQVSTVCVDVAKREQPERKFTP